MSASRRRNDNRLKGRGESLAAAWSRIPLHVKTGIMAMVDAVLRGDQTA